MGPGTRIFYKSEIEEKSKQADLGFVWNPLQKHRKNHQNVFI
jgi:hypothetical protein